MLQTKLGKTPAITAMALFGGHLRICGGNLHDLEKILLLFKDSFALGWRKTNTYLEDAFIYYLQKAKEN